MMNCTDDPFYKELQRSMWDPNFSDASFRSDAMKQVSFQRKRILISY